MTFPLRRVLRPLSLFALLALALASTCCRRGLSEAEKQTRAELRQALREHSYEHAEELARGVVAAHPQENGGWERLTRAQLGLADFATAKLTLVKWRATVHKPTAKLEELTGDIAAAEDDHAAAITAWQQALAANPKQASLLRKIARVQNADGQWQEENATLTTLLGVEERGSDRMDRALSFRRLHRWSEALQDSRRAQELAPGDPAVQRGAKLFERLSRFLAEMRELDARLVITPRDDQLLADRALLFLRGDDAEMALDDARAAAKTAPWAMRPSLLQAIALLQLGRVAEAEKLRVNPAARLEGWSSEFLQTLSRLDSDISVERSNAELYVARAWQLNDAGQPTLALEDAETALRFDSKSAGAETESAYALAKLGRADEALEHVKRATEFDANFSTAWHYRGELEMARDDFVAAVDSLSHSLAINQTSAALLKREECYRQIGLFAKADEDHRALQQLDARPSVR